MSVENHRYLFPFPPRVFNPPPLCEFPWNSVTVAAPEKKTEGHAPSRRKKGLTICAFF